VAWLILGYLCSHPDASDTATGVSTWWVGAAKGIEPDAKAIRVALDVLVEQRWLDSLAGYSGPRRYRLNRELKTILQQFFNTQ